MRTTIDRAGRLVLPKQLRDQIGLTPGQVEVTVDGGGIRVEPTAGGEIVEADGHLFIASGDGADHPVTVDAVRALRHANQR